MYFVLSEIEIAKIKAVEGLTKGNYAWLQTGALTWGGCYSIQWGEKPAVMYIAVEMSIVWKKCVRNRVKTEMDRELEMNSF